MAQSTRQILEQSQRTAIQFLMADLTVALTFLDVADVTQSEETRRRNRRNALSAYETVLRLLPRVSPTEEERRALDSKIAELRDRLLDLGYIRALESSEATRMDRRI